MTSPSRWPALAAVVAAVVLYALSGVAQDGSTRLVRIEGGVHFPFYGRRDASPAVRVESFELEAVPVTNEQFLRFVGSRSRWRRDEVPRIFADEGYLAHWAGPTELGDARPRQPVTHVSWFAARAYCDSLGRRLPTEHEWEHVAKADETQRDASRDPVFVQRILRWYSRPRGELNDVGLQPANRHGVRDMHGLVWEWILDFNAAMITGDDRQRDDARNERYCGGASVQAQDVADYAAFMRYAYRSSLRAQYTVPNLGFRCAR
ncbi:MAG: formylglycine-generating enzyme family protein [Sandaracinus sp.]|nr:formylglycine-generating enzyme family protein [Sandaracinus sp.]